MSAVAGIVGPKGEVRRVVVTQRFRMRHHVGKDERLFILPGVEVKEPVPADQAHDLVAQVEKHVRGRLGPLSLCDGCRACCKTLYIAHRDIYKPSHQMCRHACTSGCGIYDTRPAPCRAFACLWLRSQHEGSPMAPDLRPDRCGVIFTDDTAEAIGGVADPDLIELHPERGREASPIVAAFVDYMQKLGKRFKVITHYHGER